MGNSIQEMLEILGPDGGTYRRLETEVHKAEYGNRLSSSTPHHFSSVFAYGASRSHRRIVHDLLFFKKLICSVIDAPDLLELLDFRASRHLRHPQLFARRHYTTQYMFHSAFPRLQRLASNLHRHLDFFNMSRDAFKRERVTTSLS
ncbi:hypothetical protein J6590_098939 [Homalodisca vitripennis]|nr:hypothetical protein J6590_098939 [Homalodisca vitripennis]